MKWQPIETAPKDGTHVLLWRPYDGVIEAWWANRQFSGLTWGQTTWNFGTDPKNQPTHWMPLPPVPDAQPAQEEKR